MKPILAKERQTLGAGADRVQLATYPQSPFSGPARCCDVTDLYQAFSQRTRPLELEKPVDQQADDAHCPSWSGAQRLPAKPPSAFIRRAWRPFAYYLIPKPTFEILSTEGPPPGEVGTEVQRYLESRRLALTQELATVAILC